MNEKMKKINGPKFWNLCPCWMDGVCPNKMRTTGCIDTARRRLSKCHSSLRILWIAYRGWLYHSLLPCAWSFAVLDVQLWCPWLPKSPSFRPKIFVLYFSFDCIHKMSSLKIIYIKKFSLKLKKNSNAQSIMTPELHEISIRTKANSTGLFENS